MNGKQINKRKWWWWCEGNTFWELKSFCGSPYPGYLFHPILLLWQNGWVESKLAEAWRIHDGGLVPPSGRTRSDGQDNTRPLPLWQPCHHLLFQETLIYPDGLVSKAGNHRHFKTQFKLCFCLIFRGTQWRWWARQVPSFTIVSSDEERQRWAITLNSLRKCRAGHKLREMTFAQRWWLWWYKTPTSGKAFPSLLASGL